MKKAHVTGQYEADFSPPWFGKWREKVHANRFMGYPGVSLLRHEVYSQDGTPNEMRAYVRSTEPPFPMLVTVRSGGKVYRHIGTHYAMFKFSGQPDTVHVTVTAVPFETYTELETCLEEIVTKGLPSRSLSTRTTPTASPIWSQVLCPICWTTVRDTALNCGHTYCQTCAGRLVDCATCRQRVTAKSRIYL
ncbi:E3 ubiquitin-protein ligase RGLG2-like protein [Aphelenchoides avenae]|nr:E3 ubiquitin-protein ligase RGLG2-like protein [Aphelenchus avenae]